MNRIPFCYQWHGCFPLFPGRASSGSKPATIDPAIVKACASLSSVASGTRAITEEKDLRRLGFGSNWAGCGT